MPKTDSKNNLNNVFTKLIRNRIKKILRKWQIDLK